MNKDVRTNKKSKKLERGIFRIEEAKAVGIDRERKSMGGKRAYRSQ